MNKKRLLLKGSFERESERDNQKEMILDTGTSSRRKCQGPEECWGEGADLSCVCLPSTIVWHLRILLCQPSDVLKMFY
jgi:hypothetical protein